VSGTWQVIGSYTRAQALEDGTLIDVGVMAEEAGFRLPVAMTVAVWARCVSIPAGCVTSQDEPGRLWDVVWMASLAAKRASDTADRTAFVVMVAPPEHDERLEPCNLWLHCGPGDDAEPVLTIMTSGED
jgi:hypothetical protein